jgi:hypothetical protein
MAVHHEYSLGHPKDKANRMLVGNDGSRVDTPDHSYLASGIT